MNSFKIEPYVRNPKQWNEAIKDKHLIFDTDAIISILAFKAEAIFDDFKKLKTKNCLIDPVYKAK